MAGRSFLEALEDKYADSDVSTSNQVFVMKNMDVAGESGRVRVPREMSLHQADVCQAGDLAKITEICAQVTSLDLAQNKMTDWAEVFKLLSCMPNVSFLNLSDNCMEGFDATPEDQTQYPRLTSLALNHTFLSMESACHLLSVFPNVTELHLCLNGYVTLDCHGQHTKVTSLFLNQNSLSDFSELLKLDQAFPKLQQLLLIKNPVCQLADVQQISQAFPCLSCINLSESKISSWEEVEKFKHFPAVTDVRINNLPLYEGLEEKKRRQLVISYLPNVTRLNLSQISHDEREMAERMFVRYFLNSETQPDRFHELKKKHGDVQQFAEVSLKPEVMKTVEVKYNETSKLKTIDVTRTVGELKKELAQELYGRQSKDCRIFHQQSFNTFRSTELRVMKKKLYSLQVDDGDTIFLDLKE